MKGFIFLLGSLLILLTASLIVPGQGECLADDERIDCYLVDTPSQLGCQAKGCEWCEPSQDPDTKATPSCYLPKSYGYFAATTVYTPNGFTVNLRRVTNITYFGRDYANLTLTAEYQSNYRLRLKITPDNTTRWEVPLEINPPKGNNSNRLYEVETIDEPFSIKVIRKATGAVVFDTSLGGLTFSEQFLQLSTRLSTKNLYGIGENEQPSFKHDFTKRINWPLWTRDNPPQFNANMYGTQPFVWVVEDNGDTHGVVFVNSNTQEFTILPTPALLYKTIGGIFDIYIFMGPTPENAAQQYSEAVGRMDIPAYWSLGFQLCKYNYASLENVKAAYNRTAQYGIPHDVQYIDSDLMERELDFTLSQERYSELPNFIKELHDRGMKFITIIDPGISNGEPKGSYPPYDLGTQMDVFIKKLDGTPVQGKVWPVDPVQYPDFTKNSTAEWWLGLFLEFKKMIDFDGIWIDMNEPVNFASGDLFEGCEINSLNSPPFIPHITNRLLWDGTLCPDHVDSISTHYNTHSMYGWFESIVTKRAILASRPGNRSFILSRSTFLGSGKYTAHWLGDNFSMWSNLHTSIIGMLQYNWFGIPQVGADICGFIGNATEELCLRWQQLGAFYVFSRNHNGGHKLQDPGVWGDEVALATKQALEVRYTLLPYLYTLFYYHKISGDTVARALWHEFPTDPISLAMDRQFLWGDGVMIAPVLEEGVKTVNVYFPSAARWYDYYTGMEIKPTANPPYMEFEATFDKVVLFVKGGVIIPSQEPGINTVVSSKNPFNLIVPLNSQQRAEGRLYFDDGDSADTLTNGNYYLAHYVYENGNLTTIIENDGFALMKEKSLSSIRIMGSLSDLKSFSRVVMEMKKSEDEKYEKHLEITKQSETGQLIISNIDIPMNIPFTLRFQ